MKNTINCIDCDKPMKTVGYGMWRCEDCGIFLDISRDSDYE